MKRYEMVREIFNSCSNNQMRDVFIQEIETDDVDTVLHDFLTGKEVQCEKFDHGTGLIVYEIDTDGMHQRITFTALS